MKKIILTIMLGLASNCAVAEWTRVSVNDVYIQYADFGRISKAGGNAIMWELLDYVSEQKGASGNRYLSEKIHREYDCRGEQVRLLAISGFNKRMGEGKVTYSDSNPAKWEKVRPASVNDFLLVKACSNK